MFKVNIHSVVAGVTFRVMMYGRSFLVSFCSIRRVLDMPQLDACVPSFSSEVQAFTRGELTTILTTLLSAHRALPSYISIASFSKLAWIIAMFLTYSFYLSTNRTET